MDEFEAPVLGTVVITENIETCVVQITEAVGFVTLDDEERYEI